MNKSSTPILEEISSTSNGQFRLAKSLLTSKGIKEESAFLLSGADLVNEFLNSKATLKIHAEIIAPGMSVKSQAKPVLLSKKLFAEIDVLGTHSNILVVESPGVKTWVPETKLSGLSLIIPLGDPGNLGACLRSATAFGADQVILTKEAANPFLPKSMKASGGSAYRMKLLKGPSLFELPEQALKTAIGLDSAGKLITQYKWQKESLLIIGEEGSGLGSALPQQLLAIPTQEVESLNATVALSIACFHYRSQWPLS